VFLIEQSARDGRDRYVIPRITQLETQYAQVRSKADLLAIVLMDIKESLATQKTISDVLSHEQSIHALRQGSKNLERIKSLSEKYKDAVESYTSHKESYTQVCATIDNLEGMIDNGICPVCRTKVGEDHMDLQQVQKNIDELKARQGRIQGRMESLTDQKGRIEQEIRDLGFDPDDLEKGIKALEKKISDSEEKLAPVVEQINQALADLDGDSGSKADADDEEDDDSFDLED